MAKFSGIKSPSSEGRDQARAMAAYEEELAKQRERAELERIEGSKVVSSELRKAVEEKNARDAIYQQAVERGSTPEEANQLVAESGIGSVTPRLDRMAAEQRKLSETRAASADSSLGGFKTQGDKSAFEAKNAVRKLRGLEPLPEPLPADKQFLVDLEKSASFGTESALVGEKAPRGQARAFEAGIRAGYSPEETRKLISDTAARITGIVDQRREEQTTTETPKSPAKLPFFEQVYEQFRGPASTPTPTPTPPVVPQTSGTPKSPAQPPLFERTYEQFKTPTPTAPPPPATPPVNPQNMTTSEGVIASGMRGSLGGIPTPVLRNAVSDVKKLLSPLAQTTGFFKAADQLDYILGRKRNQK